MATQRVTRNSQQQNRISQGSNSRQTSLLDWMVKDKSGNFKSVLKESSSVEDSTRTDDRTEGALQVAVGYFQKGPKKASLSKDKVLEKHLTTVENVALSNGLAPEAIDILLNVALSGKFGNAVNSRILKCMIPESHISEDSVLKAVSWLCVDKCSGNTKVLFYRWLVAMFDFIDHKKQISSLYGFFFASLQDDTLCPYVCHLLYLLTKRENVKPFRVRKLLDLQAKMGMQPHLQALLSLYKFFAPTLISVSLPVRKKIFFNNSKNLWTSASLAVRLRNQGAFPEPLNLPLRPTTGRSLKRKWNSHSVIPALNSANKEYGEKTASLFDYLSSERSLPLEQLQRFPQLLESIHCLELPSQMCSVLNSPLLLHYINCVKDESILLRISYWLSQALQEECVWYNINNYEQEKEFINFLDLVIRVQCFLQEGFYSCEAFLYKSLPLWDGSSCRSQYLQLLAWIPFSSFSEVKPLLSDHLAPLFFTSSIYFKCSVLQSLQELLQNWLLWLSTDAHVQPTTDSPLETTLGGSMSSVSQLIEYTGWLCVVAMRLESSSTLLLHFILDFYEKVCDIYINYDLPIVVLFPPVIFHSALLSLDATILNQLCYIMYRYRNNWTAAKKNRYLQKAKPEFSLSSKICKEYNYYLTAMVCCLWTSRPFKAGVYTDPETIENTGGTQYKSTLNIVYHPSLLSYAASFLLQESPEEMTEHLSSIQGKKWNWYLDYLYSEGFQGLKLFIKSSVHSSVPKPEENTE
ncbi:centromere protein I isoform X1 [Mus musculus]|uniref:Centromere protein I n=2 Tax=Mus musculus TaxID=10090 RepID=CENPI_MOUSE|nr:centromere protein I [Mus musculus]NP_666036.1 centromere protein I [Mus musculus]XP_017173829.1 centromere protein I isoform X1 [Mus musculus]Q8K1K4.1 RecName: Full=Centromere protein I; Short=CENP-I; AltName: Full=FSH primary response protein 1; AltName: Full=Follicle-stimulating hormone primary response protein [Mus musculus]AAH30328.1 Centromere protein I [Mus musculus]EDL20401.1 centromere protein I [Mus musculus]|eukprot:NP_001292560.1 centromere protein I [Mus musculus]